MSKRKSNVRKKPKTASGGPYLAAAVLCEKVLTEKDTVTSLMRIVDIVTVRRIGGVQLEEGKGIMTNLSLYFHFRAGSLRDKRIADIFMVHPDGSREHYAKGELDFSKCKEAYNGVNGAMPLLVKWHGTGTYMIEIYIGQVLYSKIVFRLQTEAPITNQEKKDEAARAK